MCSVLTWCQRFLLLFILSDSCVSDESVASFAITAEDEAGASVHQPEKCSADIRNGGGDLLEAGVRYRGKCEGAGLAPSIEGKTGQRYLRFATDPSFQQQKRSRSELALTGSWFPFGEPFYMGFRVKIPARADSTNVFFYLLQFWQCAGASPIAGVRINRGYSHRINFMTRGDTRAASMKTYDLSPGVWAPFVIRAIVDPSGKNGSFDVWHDPDEAPAVYRGPFGYGVSGKCAKLGEARQEFRIKFGIYKGGERNSVFEVDYDDIRIGSNFEIVSPWTHVN